MFGTWPTAGLGMTVAFCHMSKEVVTRATEKQGAASVDRSETGAVDQSWGVGKEAWAGPMEQPRPTEGRGWSQLTVGWVQQLHRSPTQACPKTGVPGGGLAPHCPSLRSPKEPGPRSGGPRDGLPVGDLSSLGPLISPSGHLQCGALWAASWSW